MTCRGVEQAGTANRIVGLKGVKSTGPIFCLGSNLRRSLPCPWLRPSPCKNYSVQAAKRCLHLPVRRGPAKFSYIQLAEPEFWNEVVQERIGKVE